MAVAEGSIANQNFDGSRQVSRRDKSVQDLDQLVPAGSHRSHPS